MRRKLALVVFGLIVVSGLVAALMPGPEEHLAELIAELRARGEPVTLAEIDAPMPPDAENGAAELDAAMAWWKEHQPDDDSEAPWEHRVAGLWNPTLEEPWHETASPEQMDALRVLLVDLEPFFLRIDGALARSTLVWPLGPRDTVAGHMVGYRIPIQSLQTLHKLLAARAHSGATDDDRLIAIRGMLRVGTRIRSQTAIEQLVCATIFVSACQMLRRALEAGSVDPAAAWITLDAELRHRWSQRLPELIRAERANGLQLVPFFIDGSYWTYLEDELGWTRPTVWERWRQRLNGIGRADWELHPQTVGDMLERLRGLGMFLDPELSARAVWDFRDDERVENNTFAMLIPRIAAKLVQTDMSARLARVSLAAYAHREAHGAWPTSLESLAPLFPDGVPLDPYTERPFVLQRDGDALVLRAQPWESLFKDIEALDDPLEHGHVWRLPPR